MPELPEVRTVVKGLKAKLINKTILNVNLIMTKLCKNASKEEFENYLKNETIIDIKSVGKYIIFELTNNKNLISHLRMTGKYFIENSRNDSRKHDYVEFELNDSLILFYNDTRQFGSFYIKNKNELFTTSPMNKLGKEPWDINVSDLYNATRRKSVNIKTFLLDQSYILGIGNIYANEILFDAKLDPKTKINKIPLNKWKDIIESSKRILNSATLYGGSTINSYAAVNGLKGNYQNFLKVHLRKNEKCFRCNNKIETEVINQRMTYYCKNCQKENYE